MYVKKTIILFIFFKLSTQEINPYNQELFLAIALGDLLEFEHALQHTNISEFDVDVLNSIEDSETDIHFFNNIPTIKAPTIHAKCHYRFNICEFLTSRFANYPELLFKFFDVIEKHDESLLHQSGILERALCPWFPHIMLGSEPNHHVIDKLLDRRYDANSEELGATPLHFLLILKANLPIDDIEFRRIFVLLMGSGAKRKVFLKDSMSELLSIEIEKDPIMHKIYSDNRGLVKWIMERYPFVR